MEPSLDRSAYELKTASNARSLLQRVSAFRGNISVWLGDTAAGAGLRAFLNANGRGQFILHDGDVDYRDPEVSNQEGNRIGKASVLIPASTEWVQYTGEFTYDKAQTDVQHLLAWINEEFSTIL